MEENQRDGTREETKDNSKDVYSFVKTYLKEGLSVIQVTPRDKKVVIKWKKYQKNIPTIEDLIGWFEGKTAERNGPKRLAKNQNEGEI